MANTFTKVASLTFPTGVNTATFSAIPSIFTDLMIYYSVRGTNANVTDSLFFHFNGDTSAAYKRTTLYNDYTAIYANGDTTGYQNYMNTGLGNITGNTGFANSFGTGTIYISEYASSSKFKSTKWQGASENNSDTANQGYNYLHAGAWINTAPITSITFTGGSNFASGSEATIYAVTKG
jgi:hypothetical protein